MRRSSGISLIILIFLSLCLITFALLSLSGANADQNLSRKSADRTSEYYLASSQAALSLSEIDQYLADCFRKACDTDAPEQTYYEYCLQITDNTENYEFPADLALVSSDDLTDIQEWITISYTVPLSEEQNLCVRITPVFPVSDDDTFYRISSWKVENTRDWSADTSQNLLKLE